MRTALALVLLVGCATPPRAKVRWPDHRQREEQRIEQLEAQVVQLRQSQAALEQRIGKLEAILVRFTTRP